MKQKISTHPIYDEYYINKSDTIDLDIVCVYNSIDYYKNELISSLFKQTTSYSVHIIGINNINNQYSSMSKAYNDAENSLQGEHVIFLHQDIRFNSSDSLHNIITEIKKINDDTIYGYAGVIRQSRQTISTSDASIEVETLDECFFGMSAELFRKLKFNEVLCDNWHMYAVEICLHNKLTQGHNIVINADITHLSPGAVSKSYTKTLKKIITHYKDKDITAIWTTCAKVDLEKPYRLYIFIWTLKHILLNNIIRPIISKRKQ